MNIVIPFEGRVRTCIRSSYILAKRLEINKYTLTGDTFQMTGVTPEQIVILPDSVKITEGQELTDDILRRLVLCVGRKCHCRFLGTCGLVHDADHHLLLVPLFSLLSFSE